MTAPHARARGAIRATGALAMALALVLLAAALPLFGASEGLAAPAAWQEDLAFGRDVRWQVDDVPEIAALEPTIRSVLAQVHVRYRGVEGHKIAGFYPGPQYAYFHIPGWTPFYLYIRDTATILPTARYYYGLPEARSVVEEFLRLQYPEGSISATVGPDFKVDKATVVSDEESSTILAAASAFAVQPDRAWLRQTVRGEPILRRLNRAMSWLLAFRWDPFTRLIRRAHTTDWGDVKWEVAQNHTDIEPGDQWTASIYDQAIAYGALMALARLNDADGDSASAARWREEAARLREAADAALWMDAPHRGYYRVHRHLPPNSIVHTFDEDDVVAIGNAAAVYYGLAAPAKVPRILAALERARLDAGAPKVGLTLHPAYEGWRESQMDPRVYQNGAIWDWWGGRQVSGEYWSGYRALATQHLIEIARDWATHPGQVREWESPWLNRTGRDQAYAGAAAVVGQAVIEGLFGVDLYGRDLRLTPRLAERSGSIRVYQPATETYVAYRYEPHADGLALRYGTNASGQVVLRLPVLWLDAMLLLLDGEHPLEWTLETEGEDTYAAVVVPSGIHRVDMVRLTPPGT